MRFRHHATGPRDSREQESRFHAVDTPTGEGHGRVLRERVLHHREVFAGKVDACVRDVRQRQHMHLAHARTRGAGVWQGAYEISGSLRWRTGSVAQATVAFCATR